MMHGARPMRSTRRLQNLQSGLPKWWSITNKADTGEPTLVSIFDEIGYFGVSAGSFLAELSGINGDLDVHLNSPGGDVFDAIAIYNSLKARKGVVAITIDGLAASAASFIAQAASPGRLEMAPFSTMMIHDGFAAGIGNAADMRDLAEQLDDASDNIAGIYAARTGKPAAYWRAKMQATTWYKDHEAVTDGLADRIRGDDGDIRAAWDMTVFNAAGGDKPLGDGWVMGADGKPRFDPDGDGDDDATPEGDTDHDYFDESGKQIKPVPPCPDMAKAAARTVIYAAAADHGPATVTHTHAHPAFGGTAGGDDGAHSHEHTHDGDNLHHHAHDATMPAAEVTGHAVGGIVNADVDNSPWDASKAWHNGTTADDPAAFYEGICAGKKNGDPSTQNAWALPYRYTPTSPPNAAGVRAALARLSQTQGLINKSEAGDTLEAAMKKVNPEWKPGDQVDPALLSAVLVELVRGGR